MVFAGDIGRANWRVTTLFGGFVVATVQSVPVSVYSSVNLKWGDRVGVYATAAAGTCNCDNKSSDSLLSIAYF